MTRSVRGSGSNLASVLSSLLRKSFPRGEIEVTGRLEADGARLRLRRPSLRKAGGPELDIRLSRGVPVGCSPEDGSFSGGFFLKFGRPSAAFPEATLDRLKALLDKALRAHEQISLRQVPRSGEAGGGQEVLEIIISASCNEDCVFCGERGSTPGSYRRAEDIEHDLERLRPRVDVVIFTGSEPTLSPLLSSAVAAAARLGYRRITLITNGRRLQDKAYLAELLSAGLNEVIVSIHAPSAEAHDAIVGKPGAFAQTRRGLENLAASERRGFFRLNLNYTVIKANLAFLRPMTRLAEKFGADHLNFNVVEPRGGAADKFDEVMPRYREVMDEAYRSGLDFLSSRWSLARVPACAGGFDWVQNLILMPRTDNPRGYMPEMGRAQGPPCKECLLADRCPGVWTAYVDAYGWGEFSPVRDPSGMKGRVLVIRSGAACRCGACGREAPEPPLETSLRGIHEGFRDGYRRLELAGCEPLLEERSQRLVVEAGRVGFENVAVETGARGALLEPALKAAGELKGRNIIDLIIRVDRSAGSLREAVSAMRLARARGFAFSVRLRPPADGLDIGKLRQLSRALGARSFELGRKEDGIA